MSADTLPGLLVERAAAAPNAVALRFFRQGKWNDVTLGQLQEKAAAIGSGLSARGVKSGEVVAVLAEDGPLCLAAELGAQGIGAVVLALDPALFPAEVISKIQAAGAVAVIAGDQEQFDKVDESRSDVPTVRLLVVDATRGLRELERLDRQDRDRTMTVAQLSETSVSTWAVSASALGGSASARIDGSGSSSHESILAQVRALAQRLTLSKSDALCSLQPLSNATEHALAIAGPLLTGSVLHFRGRSTPQLALRQVQPTVIYANPNWLARVSAETDAQVARATGLKRFALTKGLKRTAPRTEFTSGRRPNMLRIGGVVAALLVLIMLAVTSSGNDVVRVVAAVAIVLGVGLGLLSAGHGVAGPIRRRYGLSRCRAVLTSDGTNIPGADLLGALQVPLIDAMEATS
jgi:long-chain acyl-CoA synthetase